jgi:hypothetical protein
LERGIEFFFREERWWLESFVDAFEKGIGGLRRWTCIPERPGELERIPDFGWGMGI